jgi:hypothetical protein
MPQSIPVWGYRYSHNKIINLVVVLSLFWLACLSAIVCLCFKQEEIRYWQNRTAIEVLCGYLFPFYEEIINDSMEDLQYESSSLF